MEQTDGLVSKESRYSFGSGAYEQILLNAPVAISITDAQGNILLVNQSFLDITGYMEQELIGKNSSILSYKMTPKSVYKNLWETISSGQLWQGRLINRRKNGSFYVAEISISRIENESGKHFYYAIQKDITETHRLQTHQKNQSALFQAVLNSAPIAMALIDKNSQVLFSNQRCEVLEKQLETSPLTLLVKNLKEDYDCDSIEDFLGEKTHRSKNIHIDEREASGEKWFDFSLVKIPVTDTKAEAYFQKSDEYYTLIGVQDRTKEKLFMEERRLNTITLMTNDNKFVHSMQEVMMATLHQLQGPLNMIDSAVTILKQSNHSCPGLQAMDEAMLNANQALEQVQDAIPERTHESAQPVNLNQTVRDVISISTNELLNRSTRIELHLDPTLRSINGKPHRLLLAIKQLIDNSLDAIHCSHNPDRAIVVSTLDKGDETIVCIEDSGNGISDDIRIKMFQPFFSTKPKAHIGCRGVGLAIVNQVLNEHAAMFEVGNSEKLGGASIQLIFPKITE
ncbi:nitrogen fixation negative regulator NifL [Vibrio hannami]|uniref:nitrogen fixation negative regulator NifL n=1 Tax=Vibrio hannami TaxID=2717094 RepID=UPI0024104400|nr:nitrogen fixation negative regulator NifL [Vibrio hannami]MDG3085037.1 nitrogen fixation negative regulator NifL [Vibrio hannami]